MKRNDYRLNLNDGMNRVEVIDWTKEEIFGGGRVFVAWRKDIEVVADIQDDGRTIKVFIKDHDTQEN